MGIVFFMLINDNGMLIAVRIANDYEFSNVSQIKILYLLMKFLSWLAVGGKFFVAIFFSKRAGKKISANSVKRKDEVQGAAVIYFFKNILLKTKQGVCCAVTPCSVDISYWFSWRSTNGRIGMQILQLKKLQ